MQICIYNLALSQIITTSIHEYNATFVLHIAAPVFAIVSPERPSIIRMAEQHYVIEDSQLTSRQMPQR